MGAVEGAAVSLVMERDMSVWQIGWDSRLLAAVYSVSKIKLDASLVLRERRDFLHCETPPQILMLLENILGRGLLWNSILRARSSDQGARAGVCHVF